MSAVAKAEMDEQQKEKVAQRLAISFGCFMCAVTMVVPTRAPLVLQIKKGDAAATAKAMGSMSAIAAVIELVVNPVLSKLSDEYGRKPFLLTAPCINAFLHSLVVLWPQTLAVQFIDRMISGAFIFGFAAPMTAGIADLFASNPQKLGAIMADVGTYSGIGCAIGPAVGSSIGGAKSFAASSCMFLATCAYVNSAVTETLADDKKKKFRPSDINPFLFLKLFKTPKTTWLTITNLLQSFGDYMNVYDINNLFMMKVLNYKDAEIGRFATTVGLTQIAGGKFTSNLIKKIGLKPTTLFSNMVWIVGMGMMANARNTATAFFALFIWTFGHQRASPVQAYLQKYGGKPVKEGGLGMGRAEITGAVGNLTAWCKAAVPLFYSNLFAYFTSNGRNVPGAPYYAIGVLTALSQLTFQTADASDAD